MLVRAELEPASTRRSTGVVAVRRGPVSDPMEAEADRIADRLPLSVRASRTIGRVADAPLPTSLRGDMEQRFGHDFSKVRVHADVAAAETARAVNAAAYTVGNSIVFGAGRFAPDTSEGMRLLAHELTHVVQQSRTTSRMQRKPDASAHNDGPIGGSKLRAPVTANLDNFDHGSPALKPEHDVQLHSIVQLYFRLGTASPGTMLVLTGHTDLTGDERGNVALGRRRAVEVAAALARLGVPTDFIRIESAGEREPVVDTPDREPRNRRVEARFEQTPSAFQPPGTPHFTPFDASKVPMPPPRPPIILPPSPAVPTKPAGPPTPGMQSETRPGTAGDVVKALLALPVVKAKIEEVKNLAASDLAKLKPGEKIATATVGGAVVAGAIAGVISDPEARRFALDAIDGLEVPVPGVEALKLQVKTKDSGGVVTVDILKMLGGR
jgi:outer membrane protein OmpA-like peptidoglycan-associated protein